LIAWLKFFFGGFFVNKYALDGAHRSVWNAVVAFALGWFFIYFGLYTGYCASFNAHYNNCQPLTSIVEKLFDDNLTVKVNGGKAVSGKNGSLDNSVVINTFTDAGDKEAYSVNGYNVIFDTRPRATTYDDFSVEAVSKSDGSKITYDQYKTQTDEAKKNYDVKINYSGSAICFDDALIKSYKDYLAKCSDTSDGEYNEEIAKEYEQLASDDVNGLYELYIKAYCPEAFGKDRYGRVPTVRSYYVNNFLSIQEQKNYIAIFDDTIVGDFATDGGIPVTFGGYYLKLEHTANTPQSGGELIVKAFKGASSVDLNIYFINLLKITPLYFLAPLLFALILWLTDKAVKSENFIYFGQTCKTVFSFALISAVLTFVLEIALSFVLPRDTVFAISSLIFTAIMFIRCLCLCLPRYIGSRKKKNQDDSERIFELG